MKEPNSSAIISFSKAISKSVTFHSSRFFPTVFRKYVLKYIANIAPLSENAKLDNYSYVKYYKNKIGLVAEMQCVIPGEGERVKYIANIAPLSDALVFIQAYFP